MRNVILTSSSGLCLMLADRADVVIPFFFRSEETDELPSNGTCLGSTEMQPVALLARGYVYPSSLSLHAGLGCPRIFAEFEVGSLLEGLAQGPNRAVSGLDDELRTIDPENLKDRPAAYLLSLLSLTEFGKAVLAHQEDFSRHDPIDRWWGGTRLTNDRLWRYGSVLTKP